MQAAMRSRSGHVWLHTRRSARRVRQHSPSPTPLPHEATASAAEPDFRVRKRSSAGGKCWPMSPAGRPESASAIAWSRTSGPNALQPPLVRDLAPPRMSRVRTQSMSVVSDSTRGGQGTLRWRGGARTLALLVRPLSSSPLSKGYPLPPLPPSVRAGHRPRKYPPQITLSLPGGGATAPARRHFARPARVTALRSWQPSPGVTIGRNACGVCAATAGASTVPAWPLSTRFRVSETGVAAIARHRRRCRGKRSKSAGSAETRVVDDTLDPSGSAASPAPLLPAPFTAVTIAAPWESPRARLFPPPQGMDPRRPRPNRLSRPAPAHAATRQSTPTCQVNKHLLRAPRPLTPGAHHHRGHPLRAEAGVIPLRSRAPSPARWGVD